MATTNPALDPEGKILQRFQEQLKKAEEAHEPRIRNWKEMDRAYLGAAHRLSDDGQKKIADKLDVEVFPKYALAVVETIKAAIDDDKPTLKITPTVVTDERVAGAKCLEKLIEWQRKKLGFAGERTKFIDQALRRGASIAKIPWVYETQMTTERIFTPAGPSELQPLGGMAHAGYSEPKETVTRQGAGFLCVDVTECPWDPGANRWEDVTYVFMKTYPTLDELKRMQRLGAYQWPDDYEMRPSQGENNQQGNSKRNTKDRFLLVERWELRATGVQLTAVVNGSIVVRDCPSPLRHAKLPFVFASTNPGLFTVEGMSEVELVMEEQAAIWELLNQSIMNARYQNNAVWFIDESLKGALDIKLGPGAFNWINGDPNTRIKQFQPVQTLQFAQPLIEMLITEVNQVSPANPYMSGASADGNTNDTATGIQLIQNMAAKRIERKKEEILKADAEIGRQQIQLNQQLLPAPVVWAVEDATAGTGYQQVQVDPSQIQGEYDYDCEEIADAVSKLQRKQEAQNKIATLLSIQAAVAAIPPGQPVLLNFQTMVEDFTEAFDDPKNKYLAAPGVTPAQPAAPAPGAILGAPPATPPAGAPGATAPIPPGGGFHGPVPRPGS